MKRYLFYLGISLFAVACTTEKVTKLTPAQQQARLDSMIRMQQQLIKEQEAEYRRDRLSIEVKEKADSILAAVQKKNDSIAAIPPQKILDTSQKLLPALVADTLVQK